MFFRKAKRIAELEKQAAFFEKEWLDLIQHHDTELRAAKNQIEYLVRTIRGMDDQIFSISQVMPNVAAAQPHIRTLTDGMTSRKVAESDRIADILRPELIKTYTDMDNAPKKITGR